MSPREVVGQRMNALVVAAEQPLDNRIMVGAQSRGTVRIVVEAAQPPIQASKDFRLDRDHWLVTGMTIPVILDPSRPSSFEIVWEDIPSIQDRVANSDPSLADPRATRAHANEIIQRLTIANSVGGLPPEVRTIVAQYNQPNQPSSHDDRFDAAVEAARNRPAPDGRISAAVLVATSTATQKTAHGGDEDSNDKYRTTEGKHDVVLAVTVPGRAPYPVFVHDFRRPRGRHDMFSAGLPAHVSELDPNDVVVLWDEVATDQSQLDAKVAEEMQGVTDTMQQTIASAQQAMAQQLQPPPQGAPAAGPAVQPVQPGFAANPGLSPQMRDMMTQNAQMALRTVTDPGMRAMLIQQYRLAGIPIDEENT
jgi:hypothetical protein